MPKSHREDEVGDGNNKRIKIESEEHKAGGNGGAADADDGLEELMPKATDPRLYLLRCRAGQSKQSVLALMRGSGNIISAIARDDLPDHIYVEARCEAHVKQACKGITSIYTSNVTLVKKAEMVEVLRNNKKGSNNIPPDTWVRKGDVVIAFKGDREQLKAVVEEVDGTHVHVKAKGSAGPLITVNIEDICKFFDVGDHVKIICGEQKDVTAMVVKVERDTLGLISDLNYENITVLANHAIKN